MSSNVSTLERQVHSAYERGRMRWALLGAGVLLGLCWAGLAMAARGWPFYVVAMILAALSGFYVWRGGDSGNALVPGLVVSMIPMILSATLLRCGAAGCSLECAQHCATVCAVGAGASGLLAAFLLRRHPRKHRAWLFAVALVPASGLLGCPHIGYGELGGLAVGLLLARLVLFLPSRRTTQ